MQRSQFHPKLNLSLFFTVSIIWFSQLSFSVLSLSNPEVQKISPSVVGFPVLVTGPSRTVTDVTHQLKYLTLNVFMNDSCFESNCDTLTLNSIEVKEVNLFHFGAPTNPSPTCNAEFFLLLSALFSIVSVFQFLEQKEIKPYSPSLFWTKD